jgi:hypothetical protein
MYDDERYDPPEQDLGSVSTEELLGMIDPEVAQALRSRIDDPDAYVEERVREQMALKRIQDAKEYACSLGDPSDPTGQDMEGPHIDAAWEGYIDAQDDYWKETDPERYAEMKACGQLGWQQRG